MFTLTSLQIGTALYGHITDDVLGFLNAGVYKGTTIPVRKVLGTEPVQVTEDGRLIDGVGEWIAYRLTSGERLGARQLRRVQAAA